MTSLRRLYWRVKVWWDVRAVRRFAGALTASPHGVNVLPSHDVQPEQVPPSAFSPDERKPHDD